MTLDFYYVMYTVFTLTRYNMAPHTGYYKVDLRVASYLKFQNKSILIFDTRELDVVDVVDVDRD